MILHEKIVKSRRVRATVAKVQFGGWCGGGRNGGGSTWTLSFNLLLNTLAFRNLWIPLDQHFH